MSANHQIIARNKGQAQWLGTMHIPKEAHDFNDSVTMPLQMTIKTHLSRVNGRAQMTLIMTVMSSLVYCYIFDFCVVTM